MSERVGGVRHGRSGPQVPGAGEADSDWRGDGRRGRGLTGPLALAISGLVLYLAWSALWERSHPASAAARGVREGDAAARLHAMRDLERLGPQDPEVALPALIEGLADPDATNRAAAITGLVAVVHGVGGSSSDPGQVGEAITALMALLKDTDPAVRTRSTQALWTIVLIWQGAPRVVELDVIGAAMNQTADDRDPQVRSAAMHGLGLIGYRLSDDPPSRLVAGLEDESEAVRTATAHSLVMFRRGMLQLLPKLVKLVEVTRPDYRPAYFSVLKEIRPSYSGGPAPEGMVPALVTALGSRDREVRLHVARSLGQFGAQAREAIPALVALVGERDEEGPAGPAKPQFERDLITPGWVGDAEQDLSVVTAGVLGRLAGSPSDAGGMDEANRSRAAIAALEQLLRSPNPRRRAAAATALRSFSPDATMISALGEAVGDRDETVRAAALLALHDHAFNGKFAAPEAISAALEDGSPQVRGAAAMALAAIQTGVEPMVPALIRHAGWDPAREVRALCASALQGMCPPRVTAAVLPMYFEAVESRESPPALRRSVVEALPGFGAAANRAIPAIIRVLISLRGESGSDPKEWIDLRGSAAMALGRLAPDSPSGREAIIALARALDDPAVEVRSAAIESLIKFGPAAKEGAPTLLLLMRRAREEKSASKVASIAEAVRSVAPGTPEEDQVLTVLTELLDAEPDLWSITRIIDAVALFGPRAAAALPRLRVMEESRDPRISGSARKAVTAIEDSGR
jgi:HEAT repeat protein